MDSQKFCLKWDGFQSSVTSVFDSLRQVEELVDVTLCCEGQQLRAHRMMLSACSSYFRDLLKNNPCQQLVIFLKDTSAADLNSIVEFIYKGSVNVSQSQLASFIKTAEMLQIRGLSGDEDKAAAPPPSPRRPAPTAATPPHKRRRMSGSSSAGRRSPASPGLRPRSPAAAPPGGMEELPLDQTATDNSIPPPPPVVPQQQQQHSQQQIQQPQQHVQPQETVKVEKIDLTEEEDEVSLDSTLCHVAEYEGGYDTADGAGMEQMPMMSADELGGLPPLGAGPSQAGRPSLGGHPAGQPPSGAAADDGSGSDSQRNICQICSKEYKHRVSLLSHIRVHMGQTTCPRCGKVCGTMKDLRRHLMGVHSLSLEEVWQIVPTKPKYCQPTYFYPRNQE